MAVVHDKNQTTKQKALRINLDKRIYGSFAEIGAGQEVAAQFFKAGGASGTVAKTMSAYDMTFSDAIYGEVKSKRYVSQERLNSMLDHECNLLHERLAESRGQKTLFFSFADTVVALNYHKNNNPHGWIGCRFQLTPGGEYHEVIIHVTLHENDNLLQQQTLGVVGVNLIYGCFYYFENPQVLLLSLMDNLSPDKMQIDMIHFKGSEFEGVDSRLMSLHLVKYGFSDVALFGPDGQNLQPTDTLYKKNIVVLRGRFRPIINVHLDMLENGVKQYLREPDVDKDNVIVMCELTLQSLQDDQNGDIIDEKDFLDRVDILCSLGQTVMITNYHEYYKLVSYLSKITDRQIGLIVGYPNLEYIFAEENYTDLPGGILESFATLFSRKVKLFVYPTQDQGMELKNSLKFNPPMKLIDLFRYLIANRKIEDIYHFNTKNLDVQTDNMLDLIKKGESGWEENVPPEVVHMIRDRCLFGFPCVVIPNKKEKV
ncbi:TonB-dependent receptor [Marinilongibacter aquaticus]|uniref:TonB-dependent receptor n=1 Tax=Marinilongibacter aquaticus TaxID=2975157 RepID=UPI0021BD0B3A|nr:TonB-dependent receptor [Marinilongibacter aquaticus]UBM58323.1 TonB-dependent receptor [Marinilongibacter aquaticus]